MIVLDTNVVLHLAAGRIADRFSIEEIVVSVITEMELLSYPTISEAEHNSLADFLASIHIAELQSDVKRIAIEVRKSSHLKLPDSIVAATAIHTESPLYTLDQHFNRLADLEIRRPTMVDAAPPPQNT